MEEVGISADVYSWKSWVFQGSNNNSTWTTLDTRTNETGWTTTGVTLGQIRTYRFYNTTPYRYYKIVASDWNGVSTFIVEVEMMELS